MFSKLKNTTSDTTNLESREMIVIIDLLLAQPELHIQVIANSFRYLSISVSVYEYIRFKEDHRLSRRRMIWLLPHPLPPLPSVARPATHRKTEKERPETQRQATQHDCPPSWAMRANKVKKCMVRITIFCTGLTRAAKAGPKSIVPARRAQQTNV